MLCSGRGGAKFVVERGGSWLDLGVGEGRSGLASMLSPREKDNI